MDVGDASASTSTRSSGGPHDIDLCAQLPHGALRLYVMGERAARLEDATQEDAAAMRADWRPRRCVTARSGSRRRGR